MRVFKRYYFKLQKNIQNILNIIDSYISISNADAKPHTNTFIFKLPKLIVKNLKLYATV